MASNLIGRCACPECGFHAAHVKIKTDKENAHPYRHCPECGAQYFPRNKAQADQLREKIRPGTETNTPRESPQKGEPGTPGPAAQTTQPAAPPASKAKGLFGQLAEALDD